MRLLLFSLLLIGNSPWAFSSEGKLHSCASEMRLNHSWIHEDQTLSAWYMSEAERNLFRVSFVDGAPVYKEQGKSLKEGLYTFVIGVDEALYAVNDEGSELTKLLAGGKLIFHSSFFGRQKVLGAGEFRINSEKEINYFSDGSGHFAPSIVSFYYSIDHFKHLKAHFSRKAIAGMHLPGSRAQEIKLPLSVFDNFPPEKIGPYEYFRKIISKESQLLDSKEFSLDYTIALMWSSKETSPALEKAIALNAKDLLSSYRLSILSRHLSMATTLTLILNNHPEGSKLLRERIEKRLLAAKAVLSDLLAKTIVTSVIAELKTISELTSVPMKKRAWFIAKHAELNHSQKPFGTYSPPSQEF